MGLGTRNYKKREIWVLTGDIVIYIGYYPGEGGRPILLSWS